MIYISAIYSLFSDRVVVVVYPLPWPLLVGRVQSWRLWSRMQEATIWNRHTPQPILWLPNRYNAPKCYWALPYSWLPMRRSWDRPWSIPLLYGRLLYPRPALTNCKSCRMQHWDLPQDAHKTHTRSAWWNTNTFSIHEHLQLRASQYKQKTQHPSHFLTNIQHTSTLQY